MPKGELDNLSIMVTRPEHQAAHLCELIEREGGRPLLFPVLEILEPEDSGALVDIVDRLDEFDIAVFISPNAVNKAMNLIKSRRELPATLKIAAVGKSSAKELRNYLGRDPDIFPKRKFNSEALLAMDELQDIGGRRVVIFRGDGGREYLGDTLRGRGAEVVYANAYRRGRPKADVGKLQRAWAHDGIDVITVTSGDGLRNLFDMVGKLAQHWLRKTQLVVVSERLVPLARELGFKHDPVVAEEASDEALIAAIKRWRAGRPASPSSKELA
ncbi:MAG: uroporphyrinogen-III synthase [Gammaproteobacteria bacterium]